MRSVEISLFLLAFELSKDFMMLLKVNIPCPCHEPKKCDNFALDFIIIMRA